IDGHGRAPLIFGSGATVTCARGVTIAKTPARRPAFPVGLQARNRNRFFSQPGGPAPGSRCRQTPPATRNGPSSTARLQRFAIKGPPSKVHGQRPMEDPWSNACGQRPVIPSAARDLLLLLGNAACSLLPVPGPGSRVPGPGSRVPSLGPRVPGFPSWEKSPTKRPRMNRGPVSVRHCLRASARGAVDQLHVCHRRVVAVAEAALEDPQVAARAQLVARAELDEQLAHRLLV